MREQALSQLSVPNKEEPKKETMSKKQKIRVVLTIVNFVSIAAGIALAVMALLGLLLYKIDVSSNTTIFDTKIESYSLGYSILEVYPLSIIPLALIILFFALAIAVLVVFIIKLNKGIVGPIVQLACATSLLAAAITDLFTLLTVYNEISYDGTLLSLAFYSNHIDNAIALVALAGYLFIYNIASFIIINRKSLR